MTDTPGDAAPVDGLMVSSDVNSSGTYTVTLHMGADRSRTLDARQAVNYGVAVVQRAAEAAHAFAQYRLFTSDTVMAPEVAREILYKDVWPRIQDAVKDAHRPTAPLVFVPALAVRRDEVMPVVRVELDGEAIGGFSPDGARAHGLGVIEAVAFVRCDNAVFDAFRSMGADEQRSRAFIAELPTYMPPGYADEFGDDASPDGP